MMRHANRSDDDRAALAAALEQTRADAYGPAGDPEVPPAALTNSERGVKHVVSALLGGVVLGAIVALMGTIVHRQWYPWLLIAALVATVTGGVWMAAWKRSFALIGYFTAWTIGVLVFAGHGPGGDVLVPGQDLGGTPAIAGQLWMNVGTLCALAPIILLLPRRRSRGTRRGRAGRRSRAARQTRPPG